MPLMTGNFSDVAERVSKQYWYDHTQSSLKVTNTGLFPIIVEVSDEVKVINAGANYTFNEEFKSFFVRCKTKKGNESAAFSIETDSYRAAILNGGAGGGLTTGQVETIVDGKMGALVSPVTSGLTITTPASPYAVEVGASVTPAMSWTIANSSNAKSAKIVETTNSNATIATITVAASGTYTFGSALSSNSVTAKSYKLDVTDKLDRVISSTARSINWYYPIFQGSSSKASGLTESEIKAFVKTLKTNASGTYNYSAVANTYKWLFVHESFNPTSFKAGGFDVPMQAPINITIENDYGVSISLKGYRTTSATSGALDLVVS